MAHFLQIEWVHQVDGGAVHMEALHQVTVPCDVRPLSSYQYMELVQAVADWLEQVDNDDERQHLLQVTLATLYDAAGVE